MPVTIEEMTSHFEVRDQAKLKKLVQEEVKKAVAQQGRGGAGAGGADPADPSAGGRPNEGG
jgi:hypothetical protein